ncbi:hypothetical protein N665_0040s0056 [Sinapis alba]|nr:hypothetical protein N665_0040s0056 [Sinapis alba]
MGDNRDLKLKRPMESDYCSYLEEAFKRGTRETRARYRTTLAMFKEQMNAIVSKHNEEIKVNRIQAKLELLDDLIEFSALKSEKEKLEENLRLAHAKMADVKVPDID